MSELTDEIIETLAGPVVEAFAVVLARIPPAPAAELGRLRVAGGGGPSVRDRARALLGAGGAQAADPAVRARGRDDSPLGSLPPLLVERLLGALELTVAALELHGVPDLSHLLGAPRDGALGAVRTGNQSEAASRANLLEQVRPGALALVAAAARRLAVHPRVAALSAVAPGAGDEEGIAAAHGAAHLALGVATAAVVLSGAGVQPWASTPPAVVGAGVHAAVLLLRDAPVPAGYADAVLARARAEYLMPRHAVGVARVAGHRFGLLEGGAVPEVDFGGNGLVVAVAGGAVIRTGVADGSVRVTLIVRDGPPDEEPPSAWDEIVEVSWRAARGGAGFTDRDSFDGMDPHLRGATPPWPGDYRLRVYARGRDRTDAAEPESYQLVVWSAAPAPEIVHRRYDALGHRLRGEPEPVRPALPEEAFRWLRHSGVAEGATVTVVTGLPPDEVVRAFGGDPREPVSLRRINHVEPTVAVLDVGNAVVAVEYFGSRGSTAAVLARASVAGRAASMYWSLDGMTQLSFAERGQVLLSVEPFGVLDGPVPMNDLDFGDPRRSKRAMGLLAVRRFTGHGFTADELERIATADTGYRIGRI